MSVQGLPPDSAPALLTEEEFYQRKLDTAEGLSHYKDGLTSETARKELVAEMSFGETEQTGDIDLFRGFSDYGDYVQWYAERWSLTANYADFARFTSPTRYTNTILYTQSTSGAGSTAAVAKAASPVDATATAMTRFKGTIAKTLESGIHEINMNLLQLVDVGNGKVSGMPLQFLNLFVVGMTQGGTLGTYTVIENFINSFCNPLQENPRSWAREIVDTFDAYFKESFGEHYYTRDNDWLTLRTSGARGYSNHQDNVAAYVLMLFDNLNDDTALPLETAFKAPVFDDLKTNTRLLTENMRDELAQVKAITSFDQVYSLMVSLAGVDGVINDYTWQKLCDMLGVAPELIDKAAPQIVFSTGRPGRDGSPTIIEKEIWPTMPVGTDAGQWAIATKLAKGRRSYEKDQSLEMTLNFLKMPLALGLGLAAGVANPVLGIAVGATIAGGFGYEDYSASRATLSQATAYNAASIVTGVPLANDEQVLRLDENFEAAMIAGTVGVLSSVLIPGGAGSYLRAGSLGVFNGVLMWASDPRQSSVDKAESTLEYKFYNPETQTYDLSAEESLRLRSDAEFQVLTGLAFQVVLGAGFGVAGEGAGQAVKATFCASMSRPGTGTMTLPDGTVTDVNFVTGNNPGEVIMTLPDGTTGTARLDEAVAPAVRVKTFPHGQLATARAYARGQTRVDGVEHTVMTDRQGVTVTSGSKTKTGTGPLGDAATPAERQFFGTRIASHTHVMGEAPLPGSEDLMYVAATAALEKGSVSLDLDGFNAAGDDVTVTVRADYDAKTGTVKLSIDDPQNVRADFAPEAALLPEYYMAVEAEVNAASKSGDIERLNTLASGSLHAGANATVKIDDRVYVFGTMGSNRVAVRVKGFLPDGRISVENPDVAARELGRPLISVSPDALVHAGSVEGQYDHAIVWHGGKKYSVLAVDSTSDTPLGLLPYGHVYIPNESQLIYVEPADVFFDKTYLEQRGFGNFAGESGENAPTTVVKVEPAGTPPKPRSTARVPDRSVAPDRTRLHPGRRGYVADPAPKPPPPRRPFAQSLPKADFDKAYALKPGDTLTLGREGAEISITGASQRVSRTQVEIGRTARTPQTKTEQTPFTLTNKQISPVTITRGPKTIECRQNQAVELKYGDIITLPDGTKFVFNVPYNGETVLFRPDTGELTEHVVAKAFHDEMTLVFPSGRSDELVPIPIDVIYPLSSRDQARHDAAGMTRGFYTEEPLGRAGPRSSHERQPEDDARQMFRIPPRVPVPVEPAQPTPRQGNNTLALAAAGGAAVAGTAVVAAGGAYMIASQNDGDDKNNLVTGRLLPETPVYIVNEKNEVEKGWSVVRTDAATNEVIVGRFNLDTGDYETRSLHAKNVATVQEFENATPLDPKLGLSDFFIAAQSERQQDLIRCQLSKEEFDLLFGSDRIKQANVGDCYLLAAFDALDNTADFELLMRKSIDIITDEDGTKHYFVSFPLGEAPVGPPIEVTDLDLAPQDNPNFVSPKDRVADTGEVDTRQYLTTVTAALGYQILEAAYIKLVTEGDNKRHKIEGGFGGEALVKMFGTHAEKVASIPAKDNAAFASSKKTTASVTKILLDYNKNSDVLSVSSLPRPKGTKKISQYDAVGSSNLKLYYQHAYSISNVTLSEDKTQVLSVEIVNPWDTGEKFTLPYDDFLQNFSYLSGARLK